MSWHVGWPLPPRRSSSLARAAWAGACAPPSKRAAPRRWRSRTTSPASGPRASTARRSSNPAKRRARYGADGLFVVTVWNPGHAFADTAASSPRSAAARSSRGSGWPGGSSARPAAALRRRPPDSRAGGRRRRGEGRVDVGRSRLERGVRAPDALAPERRFRGLGHSCARPVFPARSAEPYGPARSSSTVAHSTATPCVRCSVVVPSSASVDAFEPDPANFAALEQCAAALTPGGRPCPAPPGGHRPRRRHAALRRGGRRRSPRRGPGRRGCRA